jgi:hypothetical protein
VSSLDLEQVTHWQVEREIARKQTKGETVTQIPQENKQEQTGPWCRD